jgi:hypothetical protein
MSPCFFPDGMYSTNPDVRHDGIADEPSTRVPRSCDGAGPRSKLPFGSSPAFIKDQSEIQRSRQETSPPVAKIKDLIIVIETS